MKNKLKESEVSPQDSDKPQDANASELADKIVMELQLKGIVTFGARNVHRICKEIIEPVLCVPTQSKDTQRLDWLEHRPSQVKHLFQDWTCWPLQVREAIDAAMSTSPKSSSIVPPIHTTKE